MENIGEIAFERVCEEVKNTINWMEAHYMYAGPNGSRITNPLDYEKVMTPRDWEVYCFLNKLESDLH